MRECKRHQENLVAFLYGELKEEERRHFVSHMDECDHCQQKLEHIKEIKLSADTLYTDIDEAMASVDWEALPSEIARDVMERVSPPSTEGRLGRFFGVLFQPRLRAVYAGVLLGILIGSFITLMVFRLPFPEQAGKREFLVSADFLERVELEMARRETLDYLAKSQYLLLDFVQSPPHKKREFWRSEFASQKARDLLSRKKYINPQLNKFRMAKAKEICDQIEFLFYELAQVSGELSEEEIRRIQRLIEENQLLLKIKLLKRELKESEV
ncbi:MAG: anti-sigma factor family protein [Candidatus Aminicenantes bacterium]